jgi:glycosyltransferase involved in cell wall biosynthesis
MYNQTKITVLIPAYNEEKTIGQVINAIPRDIAGNVEVIVINDGSTDNTVTVAKESGADRVVSHNVNRGVGVAFQTGIEIALKTNADIIVNIDADGQFNPEDIPKLVEPIIQDEADMATCTRFLVKEWIPEMPRVKKFGNSMFTHFINFLTGQKFTDTQCGFRAYSREAALRMNLMGDFTYTQEVFLEVVEKGMRIKEIPCRVRGVREYGKSKVVKNPVSYGLNSLLIILRAFRDYHPLRFFGSIGAAVFLVGFVMGLFLLAHFKPYPIEWLITPNLSLVTTVVGLLLLVLALIADMNDRQRKIEEEMLYRLKKFEKK